MSFAACYKWSSYCLIATGFLTLATTGILHIALVGLYACILITSWFLDTARLYKASHPWIWRTAMLAYLAVFYLDSRFLSRSLVMGLLHLLLFYSALKLLTRAGDFDFLYLYLLSFGMLLGAVMFTSDLISLPFLCLFLGCSISTLILFEIKRSSLRAMRTGKVQPLVIPINLRGTGWELFAGFPSGSLLALSLVLASGILILSAPLFFLLPRLSLAAFQPHSASPRLISGFSETVELGAIGTIQESDELVMKVQLDAPPGKLPPDLKWRGIALDHFDGKSWSRSSADRTRVPTQAGYFKLRQTALGPDILVQTFFLEPLEADAVFGSHRLLAVSLDLGELERDASDNIYSRTSRAKAMRYTAVSDLTRPDFRIVPTYPMPLPREIEQCCMQLGHVDERVASLARQITAGAVSPYEKARLLEQHFRTQYEYSLELRGTPNSPDPLAMFLFEVRRGHCEYFATAMAVMLRQLGIPSRLVNGFRAGEYNRWSGHWTVRQYNAHSWVEAYLPGWNWTEFDPTPAQNDVHSTRFESLKRFLDAADLWWRSLVLGYDIRQQSRFLETAASWLQSITLSAQHFAKEAARHADIRLARVSLRQRFGPAVGILAATLAILLLTVIFVFARSAALRQRLQLFVGVVRFHHGPETAIAGFYGEALRVLKKRGWERGRSQTPREFARELALQPFGDAFLALTVIYNRVRFGRVIGEGDLHQVRDLLHKIRTCRDPRLTVHG